MKPLILFLLALVMITGCSESEYTYLFEELPAEETGIDFINALQEDADHSIINYIYFYNGGGVAAGDVNNDGLIDLYFVSNQNANRLYLNQGDFKFKDVTVAAGVSGSASWSTGATIVDVNGDGLLDIYVCAVSGLLDFKGHNELFINNGDGTFSEQANAYGLDVEAYATQSYFFDFDKDDDLDVYIVNHAIHTSLSHGKASVRNTRVPATGDLLLKNEGGKFIDVSSEAGIYGGVNGYGLSAAIADLNNDGWEDIYVCNDFHEDDYYYINNQDGTFTEALDQNFATISRFSMGSDVADLNADGKLDLMTLDMLPADERIIKESEGDDVMLNMQDKLSKLGYKDQFSRNMLQVNSGLGYFEEVAFMQGLAATDWSWGPLFADFDNDGIQDLFIANGILRRPNDLDFKNYISNTFKTQNEKDALSWMYKSIDKMPGGAVANAIYRGQNQGFENKVGDWLPDEPSLSNGAIYTDLNNDGALDLVVNNLNSEASVFKNTLSDTIYFISIRLNYKTGNREGLGTQVKVFSKAGRQMKNLIKSRGFLSSVDGRLHFGLGAVNSVDSIVIEWPDLTAQVIRDPEKNSLLTVDYSPNTDYKRNVTTAKRPLFELDTLIDFVHREDKYNDFKNERLIPYKVSVLGPAMAVGDIDGNGFEDLFIGGASGSPAALFYNDGKQFVKKIPKAFEADLMAEDNAAAFFDADGDGDLDLYVASGINFLGNQNAQEDRLYINMEGVFEKSSGRIPLNRINTSCVAASDYDADGDQDLFVGNLSDPSNFGKPVDSKLLINDGSGNFSIADDFSLREMVTGAIWDDVDADGKPDLLISTEWGTPKIFLNRNGSLKLQPLGEELNGLWQSVAAHDADGDGDRDILLGNWGLNTKFQSYLDAPIKMFYNDFDANGKSETLIAYKIGGEYYPLNSKMELASQMTAVNKRYTNNKDFAMQPLVDIVGPKMLKGAIQYSIATLASGYLKNDNGNFSTFVPFVDALQLGPINAFTPIELPDGPALLVVGNTKKTNTYHGDYLSLKGAFLRMDGSVQPVADYGLGPFDKQVKSTVLVPMSDEQALIILVNDGPVRVYGYKNKRINVDF